MTLLMGLALLPLVFQSGDHWYADVTGEEVSIDIEKTLNSWGGDDVSPPASEAEDYDSPPSADVPDTPFWTAPCVGIVLGPGGAVPCGVEEEVDPINVSREAIGISVRDSLATLIDGGMVTIQPDRRDVLVNKPVYFTSSATEQTVTATMLGERVDVRVTPLEYEWNFGDGENLHTTSPGGPWPDGDVTHSFSSAGTVIPSVTVFWEVAVAINGQSWIVVPGMGETTTEAGSVVVVEAESVLQVAPR